MDSLKEAMSMALKRRKMSGGKPAYAEEEEQNKKQDLAPEVNDLPSAKLEIEIGMKPQMPSEMGDASEEMEMQEPDDMSSFVSEDEKAKLMSSNEKPKSLLQRAQKAFIAKK